MKKITLFAMSAASLSLATGQLAAQSQPEQRPAVARGGLFASQTVPKDDRESVLPSACARRVAIEAGVSGLWWKYAGSSGRVTGIDRFGLSAPGGTAMKELGITADAVVAAAKEAGKA